MSFCDDLDLAGATKRQFADIAGVDPATVGRWCADPEKRDDALPAPPWACHLVKLWPQVLAAADDTRQPSIDLEVSRIADTDPGFWLTIGPIVTNPVLIKHRGGKAIAHEPGTTWFVARQNGRVVGFAVTRLRPTLEPFIRLDELHVDPILKTGTMPRELLRAVTEDAAARWPNMPIKAFSDTWSDVLGAAGFARDADANGKRPVWTLAPRNGNG